MTDKDRMEQSGEIDEFWELDDASDTAAQKGSGKRQEGQDTVGRKASPHNTASRRSGSRRGVSGKKPISIRQITAAKNAEKGKIRKPTFTI